MVVAAVGDGDDLGELRQVINILSTSLTVGPEIISAISMLSQLEGSSFSLALYDCRHQMVQFMSRTQSVAYDHVTGEEIINLTDCHRMVHCTHSLQASHLSEGLNRK